jgi:uncharacterized protein (TIGR00725 family)
MKYQICVSGAAAGSTVEKSWDAAYALGRAIADAGAILVTGATVGLPYAAAKGCKDAGGMSIGYSPARSAHEHLTKYKLPVDAFDYINYTGMNYVGRDAHLIRSSDGVLTVGGRFGSLHEFTTALESAKPCGVLSGSGGTADLIPSLMEQLEPPSGSIVFYEADPAELVSRLLYVLAAQQVKVSLSASNKHASQLHAPSRTSKRRG